MMRGPLKVLPFFACLLLGLDAKRRIFKRLTDTKIQETLDGSTISEYDALATSEGFPYYEHPSFESPFTTEAECGSKRKMKNGDEGKMSTRNKKDCKLCVKGQAEKATNDQNKARCIVALPSGTVASGTTAGDSGTVSTKRARAWVEAPGHTKERPHWVRAGTAGASGDTVGDVQNSGSGEGVAQNTAPDTGNRFHNLPDDMMTEVRKKAIVWKLSTTDCNAACRAASEEYTPESLTCTDGDYDELDSPEKVQKLFLDLGKACGDGIWAMQKGAPDKMAPLWHPSGQTCTWQSSVNCAAKALHKVVRLCPCK